MMQTTVSLMMAKATGRTAESIQLTSLHWYSVRYSLHVLKVSGNARPPAMRRRFARFIRGLASTDLDGTASDPMELTLTPRDCRSLLGVP